MNNYIKKIFVKNENCLVTGATGKIGAEISVMMASIGYNLILTDNNVNKLNNLKDKIRKKYNIDITIFQCDLSINKSREKLINQIKKKFKNLRVLINNAAKTGKKEAKKFSKDFASTDKNLNDWSRYIEINLTASYHLTSGLIKLLNKNKNGRIINIGSIFSFIAPSWEMYKGLNMNNNAAYSASKGGLLQLTRWQSTFYAPNIKVNMISPGGIIRDQHKTFKQRYSNRTPLKRMGTEEDVVNAVLFLSSDLSNYITGQNLVVDGGWSIK